MVRSGESSLILLQMFFSSLWWVSIRHQIQQSHPDTPTFPPNTSKLKRREVQTCLAIEKLMWFKVQACMLAWLLLKKSPETRRRMKEWGWCCLAMVKESNRMFSKSFSFFARLWLSLPHLFSVPTSIHPSIHPHVWPIRLLSLPACSPSACSLGGRNLSERLSTS